MREVEGVFAIDRDGDTSNHVRGDCPASNHADARVGFTVARLFYAKSKIAPFKAPRRVVVVSALPRTETGKIRRAKLREMSATMASEEPSPHG